MCYADRLRFSRVDCYVPLLQPEGVEDLAGLVTLRWHSVRFENYSGVLHGQHIQIESLHYRVGDFSFTLGTEWNKWPKTVRECQRPCSVEMGSAPSTHM